LYDINCLYLSGGSLYPQSSPARPNMTPPKKWMTGSAGYKGAEGGNRSCGQDSYQYNSSWRQSEMAGETGGRKNDGRRNRRKSAGSRESTEPSAGGFQFVPSQVFRNQSHAQNVEKKSSHQQKEPLAEPVSEPVVPSLAPNSVPREEYTPSPSGSDTARAAKPSTEEHQKRDSKSKKRSRLAIQFTA